MKKIKTLLLAILVIFTVVFGTGAGCSSSKKTSTDNTLTVWGFDDPDTFKPIIRDFEKAYSGVKVNYVQKTLDDSYELSSLNAIAAGQGPDVWTMPNSWLTRHADKLVAFSQNKNAKIESEKVDPAAYFVPAVVNGATVDGKIYGLTPSIDTLRLYYNSKMLEQLKIEFDTAHKNDKEYRKQIDDLINQGPLFWDDIVALSQALTSKSGTFINRATIALGTSNNISVGNDILYLIMAQNKTKFQSDDGQTAVFNLPSEKATGETVVPAANALTFYTNFANAANPNYDWNSSMSLDTDAFTNNQTLMVFGYGSYAEALAQRYPTFKYKQWPAPQILSSSNQEIVDFARFNLMTVPSLSKQQTNAWNFVKFTTTSAQTSYVSATKRASSALGKGREVKVTDRRGVNPDTLQKYTATTLPSESRFPASFKTNFADAINAVNSGQLTAQQALDSIADKVTQLLRNKGY